MKLLSSDRTRSHRSDKLQSYSTYSIMASANRAPAPLGLSRVKSSQCFFCYWNNPRGNLEQHLQAVHADSITQYESRLTLEFSVSLGDLLRETRMMELVRWHGRLLGLEVTYEDPEWIQVSVASLSQHTDNLPCRAIITVNEKETRKPIIWDGPVLETNFDNTFLKTSISKLGLLPASSGVRLWNGQFVRTSKSNSIRGEVSLSKIMIDFNVEFSR